MVVPPSGTVAVMVDRRLSAPIVTSASPAKRGEIFSFAVSPTA